MVQNPVLVDVALSKPSVALGKNVEVLKTCNSN